MQHKNKAYTIAIITILTLSILLAAIPMAHAGAITIADVTPVDPTAGATTDYSLEFTPATAEATSVIIDFSAFGTTATDMDLSAVSTTIADYDFTGFTSNPTGVTVDNGVAKTITFTGGTVAVAAQTIDNAVAETGLVITNDQDAEAQLVTISTTSDTGTFSLTIDPAALGSFAFTGEPTIVTKGVEFTTTVVTAYDIYDNVKTDYTGAAAVFTSSDLDVAFGAITWAAGLTTALPITLNTFGDQTITVTDGAISEESSPILVSTLHHFDIAVPDIVTKGMPFTITVTAKIEDGSTLPDYAGTVHFISTDPEANLPADYTFTSGDSGTHTFAGIKLNTFGVHTITVSEDVISSVSDPITVGVALGTDISGNVGDKVTVYATLAEGTLATTPGGLLKVYWDEVHDWDATTGTGLLATAYAKADKTFKVEITIPEAVAGLHTILIYDDMAGALLTPTTEFTIDPKIVLDPTAGIVGDTITVTGTGFATISEITLTTAPAMGTITTLTTSPSIVKTGKFGSFTCTFKMPTGTLDKTYTITATDSATVPNSASADLKVGTVITLTPKQGLSGTEVTILGRGFTPAKTVDVRWMFTVDYWFTLIDDYPIDSTGTFTTTFTVPSVDTGTYTVKAIDSATLPKEATATFWVKGVTKITLTPKTGLAGDTFDVTGEWFTPSSTVTIYFDGTVLATGVATDSDGAFTALDLVVPDVAVGSYTVKAIDEEDISATATFTVSLKIITIQTRATEYLQGDTISIYGKCTEAQVDAVLEITDPDGLVFWTTTLLAGDWETVNGYELLVWGDKSLVPALPSDATLGSWNFTAYSAAKATILDTNLFTVVARPTLSTILDRLDELDAKIVNLDGDVATLSTTVGTIKTSVDSIGLKVTSIEGDVATIETDLGTLQGTVTSIDSNVATIETDIGTVKADVADILEDVADIVVEGVTVDLTPIWIAVVLSLIAAIAACYAAITMSRKIA